MGDNYLPPSISNPNSTTMSSSSSSSSNSSQTHEPNLQSNTNTATQEEIIKKDEEKQDEEEEEEECGFCLFMKEGGCRESFIDWEKCVEPGENNNEDITEKCIEVTSALQKCMEAHSDYYAPILLVEKYVEAKVIAESEKNTESIDQKEEL